MIHIAADGTVLSVGGRASVATDGPFADAVGSRADERWPRIRAALGRALAGTPAEVYDIDPITPLHHCYKHVLWPSEGGVIDVVVDVGDLSRQTGWLSARAAILSALSQRLRGPLATLARCATMVEDLKLGDDREGVASAIRSASESLLGAVDDVLDFSDSALDRPTRSELSMRECVESVSLSIAPALQALGWVVALHVAPDVVDRVAGDRARIRRLLLHMASLATRARGIGSLTLGVHVAASGADRQTLSIRFEARPPLAEGAPRDAVKRELEVAAALAAALDGSVQALGQPGGGDVFEARLDVERIAKREPTIVPLPGALPPLFIHQPGDDNEGALVELLRSLGGDPTVLPNLSLDALGPADTEPTPVLFVSEILSTKLLAQAAAGRLPARLVLLCPLARASELATHAPLGARILPLPLRRADVERIVGAFAAPPPAIEPPAPAVVTPVAVEATKPKPPTKGRVLIVEDNRVNRTLAAKMVERRGYEVDVADNGARAVAAFRGQSYELVLMDCQMPVMDGLTATRAIRALERPSGKRVPIVALTAGEGAEDRDDCRRAGMDDYLAKPLELARLVTILHRWIGSSSESVPAPAAPA